MTPELEEAGRTLPCRLQGELGPDAGLQASRPWEDRLQMFKAPSLWNVVLVAPTRSVRCYERWKSCHVWAPPWTSLFRHSVPGAGRARLASTQHPPESLP